MHVKQNPERILTKSLY